MDNSTIGKRIKKDRQRAGMTQEKLANLTGIAAPTIRQYESGRLNPKVTTLKKIAAAMSISVGYLQDGIPRKEDFQEVPFASDQAGRLSVSIDSDLLKDLDFIAKEESKTRAALVEEILFWYVFERNEAAEQWVDTTGLD